MKKHALVMLTINLCWLYKNWLIYEVICYVYSENSYLWLDWCTSISGCLCPYLNGHTFLLLFVDSVPSESSWCSLQSVMTCQSPLSPHSACATKRLGWPTAQASSSPVTLWRHGSSCSELGSASLTCAVGRSVENRLIYNIVGKRLPIRLDPIR